MTRQAGVASKSIVLAWLVLSLAAAPLGAQVDTEAAGRARAEFDRRVAAAPDGPLPRLSDTGDAVMLRTIWDGVALAPARRFDAQDAEAVFRACGAGQAVLTRYFDADAAASARGAPAEGYRPEILEGVDFMIRCAAALLEAHGDVMRGQMPGLAFAEVRRRWDELRGQIVAQFERPLRAIGAEALDEEAAVRFAVALRESSGRIAGALPEAERDALLQLARQASARAPPLSRPDLELFISAVAGR
jgi:hypothetical protein